MQALSGPCNQNPPLAEQEKTFEKRTARENFIEACKSNDILTITSLVANPILKAYHIEEGLEYVSQLDSLEAVKIILNQHPNTNTDGAIFNAQRAQSVNVNAYFNESKKKKLQPSLDFINTCKAGFIDEVKSLLANPEVNPSYNSNSALIFACNSGHLEVVKILLNDSRIDPSFPSNKPLHEACKNGHVEIVNFLLQNTKADLSSMTGPYSLLIAALEFDHIEVIKVLLQNPCFVLDAKDVNIAIKKACQNGQIKTLTVLLEDSRILYIMDKNKALNIALEYEQQEIYQFLNNLK